MVGAKISKGIIGFIVKAHHMYTVDLDVEFCAHFSAATKIIAVPVGMKCFSWTAIFRDRSIVLEKPLLTTIGFIYFIYNLLS